MFGALILAAIERLRAFYSGNVMTMADPGGMDGDGHTVNFIPALRDVATVGQGVADVATQVAATAARVEEVADAIEAGPVASVVGKSGIVTAAQIGAALDQSVSMPRADVRARIYAITFGA